MQKLIIKVMQINCFVVKQDHCRDVYLWPSTKGEENVNSVDAKNVNSLVLKLQVIYKHHKGYSYTTMCLKKSLEIALSLNSFRDIFNVLFSAKIQDGHQK